MGKHVQQVMHRVRKDNSTLDLEPLVTGSTSCPFSSAILEESSSMFELLLRDERVTEELTINLIMALFRTGIDSVQKLEN
jgi:hypothetical protein